MADYRVNLDIYNGPLDLLLYLIRREEVDIYDIPIARVTEQYVQYVEMIKALDPNLAGDFLVMAATLMEIKTRMLLPIPPAEESDEEGLSLDPRAELVRQLLEYKSFKDAAGDLKAAAHLQAMKFPRHPVSPDESQEAELDLEDAQVWDLLDAFDRLMADIGQAGRQHEIIYDDTPLELHADDILDRLQREGPMSFSRIFEGRTSRSEIVGLFVALLELVRQKKIFANQQSNFGEIYISVNPDPQREQEARPEESEESPAAEYVDVERAATEANPVDTIPEDTEPPDRAMPRADDEPEALEAARVEPLTQTHMDSPPQADADTDAPRIPPHPPAGNAVEGQYVPSDRGRDYDGATEADEIGS